MKRFVLISLLSCMIVNKAFCVDQTSVEAFALGAATQITLAASGAAAVGLVGSIGGCGSTGAAIGALSAVGVHQMVLNRDVARNNQQTGLLRILYPAESQQGLQRLTRAERLGEKCVSIATVAVAGCFLAKEALEYYFK